MHAVSQVEMRGQEEAIRGICQLEQLSLPNCLLWTDGTLPRRAEDAKQGSRCSLSGLRDVFRSRLDRDERDFGSKMISNISMQRRWCRTSLRDSRLLRAASIAAFTP